MTARIRTANLQLVSKSRADVQAMIDAMTPYEKAQMSADWLARFQASTSPDPWVHGFSAVRRDDEIPVGTGGYTGPPANGMVEIAYAVGEEFRNKGYATEIAAALVSFAFTSAEVKTVCAHTLPDGIASQRVLLKCGFANIGERVDPNDGPVWRFEKSR